MNQKDIFLYPYTVKRVIATLSQTQGWGIIQLNVPSTWTITQGEGKVVMIIDTGYSDHPDLGDALLIDKCKSFLADETFINDRNGHSTHCSGIVAARDNDIGMVGVAPKCNIIAVKVLGEDGTGDFDAIKNALRYAKIIKPDVISMSLGATVYDEEMHQLVKDLYDMNIPIIAAAGNDGRQNAVNYPGKFPEVICITAFDKKGNPAKFNSTGPETGFSAPGVDIYSTWLDKEYATLSGTSMATPFAAGIVALLLAKHTKQEMLTGQNDCKTVEQIREHLLKYADNKGIVGHDENWGYGVIDPVKLILEDGMPLTTTHAPILTQKLPWFQFLWMKIKRLFGR